MKRALANLIIGTVLGLFGSAAASAQQDFPSRPISWVVPFPAGSVTDNLTRIFARALGDKLGKPVIVDNKPGAAGIVGTEFVANAKPDGYTLLYGLAATMAGHVTMYKKLSYSPLKSFIPVHGLAYSPMLMVINKSERFKTLPELIKYAKANPDTLNFGSGGNGTLTHLAGEALKQASGISITHVPYKGSVLAMTDLLAGTIDMVFDFPGVVGPQVEAGKILAVATTNAKRLERFPDVPTVLELGLPSLELSGWSGMLVPAGTPQEIVNKLSDAFEIALDDPAVKRYAAESQSLLLNDMAKEKFAKFILDETSKYKVLIERAGVEPQ